MLPTSAPLLDEHALTADNRRLLWELQTINEIAQGTSRSLELDDVLTGALESIVRAFDAAGASVRLRDEKTGKYEITASVGPVRLHQFWSRSNAWPGEQVIATRTAVVIEEITQSGGWQGDAPLRSSISLPLLAGEDLLGILSVGAATPRRFGLADERLLAIVAGQIVAAVQNARLHESVRRAKQEWERTFDAISDPIAVFDGERRLLRGNMALASLLGRPVKEIRGSTCCDVGLCGGDCPACSVGRALTQGGADRTELTRSEDQILSVTTFPVDDGLTGACVVQVAKNVTEETRSARRLRSMSDELAKTNAELKGALDRLKSTQAQLLQAEKLSAIGQLVAGVAHELNNPLTSVIGFAQLLDAELRSAEPLRPIDEMAQDLRRIAEESARAAGIVRNLLAFARRQTAARHPQDIADVVQRVLQLRTYEFRLSGIEVVTEFEPALPPVIADGSQLQQALLNLVLNAERAMRGCAAKRLTVTVRMDRRAGAIEIAIADTGHGIDHANLSRIFDPFFTTREVGEGTGLGLSICYGIVRDHGGQISVTSKVQVGTTFSMLLPAREGSDRGLTPAPAGGAQQLTVAPGVGAQPRLSQPVGEGSDPGLTPLAILVAHADRSDRDFITAALAGWGYDVRSVERSDEALEQFRRGDLRAALIDRAILATCLDEWRKAAAHAQRRVPLIVMSVAADEGEVEKFGREQARGVLVPPIQLRTLRAALTAVI